MSTAFLLYLLINSIAVAMCLWSAALAARRIEEHGNAHRAWTFAAATLLPPATIVTAMSVPFGLVALRPVVALLPVLVIAATWSNLMTLRDQGAFVKLLHFPVLAFNSALAAIYTVRALQDLSGADLGSFGTAITGGHALLQTFIGQPHADTQPIWLHLPFILPLWLQFRAGHKLALALCSVIAAGMVALLFVLMPLAFARAESYQRPGGSPTSMRAEQRVGVKVAWADRVVSEATLAEWRSTYLGLGIDHVTLEVGPELFEDDLLLAQTKAEVEFAKRHGVEVVAICMPPLRFGWIPAVDAFELNREMAKVHWLAAEKLAPDLLVLYSGPFAQLAAFCAKPGSLAQWTEFIERGAADVQLANPDVPVAVIIESRTHAGEQLFLRMVGDHSPVNSVGLALFPDRLTRDDLDQAIETLDRWCRLDPGDKRIWVLETGACPYTTGGETGQWNFLGLVLAWAASNPRVEGVCIDSLIDGTSSRGLLAPDGRPRLAYRKLREVMFESRAKPPR